MNFSSFQEAFSTKRRPFITSAILCLAALIGIIVLGIYGNSEQKNTWKTPEQNQKTVAQVILEKEKLKSEEKSEQKSTINSEEQSQESVLPTVKTADKDKKPSVAKVASEAKKESPNKEKEQQKVTGQESKTKKAATKIPSRLSDEVLYESWPPGENGSKTESTFLVRIPAMLVMLGITCILVWLVLHVIVPYLGRLMGHPQKVKLMSVVERQTMGPNKMIMLVKVANKHLLVGMTDKNFTTLAELTNEDVQEALKEGQAENNKGAVSVKDSNSKANLVAESQNEGDSKENPDDTSQSQESSLDKKNLISEVMSQHIAALPFPKFTN